MSEITKIKINEVEYDIHAKIAVSSTKANQDASGNTITNTYETKAEATAKLAEAKTYADNAATTVKNDLLNGAGGAYDTLKELGDLIDTNVDAIDALETVAAGKQDKITGAATTIASDNLTVNRVLISNASGKVSASNFTTNWLNHGGTPIVTTSGSGQAYATTVSGMTLTKGASFIMIPHVNNTISNPTLNVNGFGAKTIRRKLSTSTGGAANETTSNLVWLIADQPIRVTYTGNYWLADLQKTNCIDLVGKVSIANGGTGATTAEAALTNLGAAPAEHEHSYMNYKYCGLANLPVSTTFRKVVYGNGKFVALEGITDPYGDSSGSKGIMYSKNQADWTYITLPMPASSWYYSTSITYGNEKFVIVSGGGNNAIFYSEDGVNWSTSTAPRTDSLSVTYGDGKFVAVGSSGAMYSTDGINWTNSGVSFSNKMLSVAYGKGKFIAVGENGANYYSEDGISWISNNTFESTNLSLINYVDGHFICQGSITYESVDGINWNSSQYPSANCLNYGNTFIASTDMGIYYRNRLSDWTQVLETSNPITTISCCDGLYIAFEQDNLKLYYSYDGINWYNSADIILQDSTDITEDVKKIFPNDSVMYVHLDINTMTANKTFKEIKDARNCNRPVLLYAGTKYGSGAWYRSAGGDPGHVVFTPIITIENASSNNSYKKIIVNLNNIWSYDNNALTLPAAALPVVTTSANGAMSAADKTKLDGIAEGANNYSLPIAGQNKLGGVKTTLPSDSKPVGTVPCYIDKNGIIYYMNTNTTYSAGAGISLSGTTFSNSGVRSIGTGTTNGTISVNTNGSTANVAVKGLGSAAYTNSTAYMPADKFKFDTYSKSITVPGTGAYTFTISSLTQRSGYTLMGYINKNSGYGDQWLISYGTYGSNVVAMVYSKYGASLTQTISCTAVWVKN